MADTLWDVHAGIETLNDKPRDATAEEREFYLRWIARTRGIVLPADARFDPKGIAAMVDGKPVLLLQMPGYGQSQNVTCEILNDAGDVVRSMVLPPATTRKGALPMTAAQVKDWTGLGTVRKARVTKASAAAVVDAIAATIPEETPATDYAAEAVRLGWSECEDGKWRNPAFPYAKVSRARHAVEDHDDWAGKAISAPLSAAATPAAISAPESDAVALLAARLAALEAIVANRAPAAVPVAANDDAARPARTERERAAIVRAWRMRCEARARADLDRRALLAANAANAALDRALASQIAATGEVRDALRAEQADRDALCEERNAARAQLQAADRAAGALRLQLRDAGRRADRLVSIASAKRRAASAADAARDRAVHDLKGADAERRAVAARFAKLQDAVDASPAAAAVVGRKLSTATA